MELSIIANNCSGWKMYTSLHCRYDSPTIALQILPEEFPKFCANLQHYMSQELTEYKDLTKAHYNQIKRLIEMEPYFPIGRLDDIAILFQHETDFQAAKEKWNRRKERLNYDNLVYMFCLDYPRYQKEAQEFRDLGLPKSFIFTRDFDIKGDHYRYTVPEVKDLCYLNTDGPNHFIFEGNFRREALWT